MSPKDWSHERTTQEYERVIKGLQYTIGARDRLKALWVLSARMLNEVDGLTISKIMRLAATSNAERFQDIFALLISGAKKGGFFVEFGACDGVTASNTKNLEDHFNWSGILAEPGRVWHKDLQENRSCAIDFRCVSSETGSELEFFEAKSANVSSLDRRHEFIGEINSSYKVQTVSLLDLLRDLDAPTYIDFMSIDCEGHEHDVLKAFDFDAYRFGFICVEQHASTPVERRVDPLLEAAGYEVLFPRDPRPPRMQVSGEDLMFVPKGSPFAGIHEEVWRSK